VRAAPILLFNCGAMRAIIATTSSALMPLTSSDLQSSFQLLDTYRGHYFEKNRHYLRMHSYND